MYENITYESILNRMLDKVSTSIDKREGSIIYDALAPCALEMQLMYIELDVILKETFGDTASREYLIRRAYERGLVPAEATYAVLKGEFNLEITEGERFSCGDLNYSVSEKIGEKLDESTELRIYEYKVICETLGVDGNRNFGSLIPINYVDKLTYAQITELLIPAEDEEDTEVFRERYLNSFSTKAYGGNIEDYLQKVNSIAGVGATKVTPVWNGGGTVLLTILDSLFNVASNTLVNTVQEIIDPTNDACGYGVAPIGHIVTVRTCDEIPINVHMNLAFADGYNFSNLENEIQEVIEGYLLELRETWCDEEYIVIRIAQIESRVLMINGIVDISDTTINLEENNFSIDTYDVPVLGVVSCA